ncbi:sodium:solute symporter family protein [Algibacter mikhailovii]|uniref:sodium:solute symporter family protein n=1 Tax=Algibacter mikhailovii TaxID=425498 RepID=UPI00249494C8|nr:sodium:solute symporter family protein [Algibacter mikhailovii]
MISTLGIGFWASKRIKTSGDFILAGKSLSTSLVGVTLFATWFGSSQIMGNPGYFILDGFSSYITLILSGGICLFVVGQFYARKLYRMNIVTINDFFRVKYNKKLELLSSLIMVLSYPHWIAAQFVALAYLFNTVMGIPFNYGVFIGASIVVFYTYIGGMWAVAYTDMVQSIMILLGLFILLFEVLTETKGIVPIFANQSKDFFDLTPHGGLEEWSAYIALLLAFIAGAIPVQEIYQRVFSAKNEKSARNGLFLGAILMILIPSIPLIIGLGGVYLHPELLNNGNSQDIIPSLVKIMTSIPVQVLFYGAMISAILSTSSGAMLAPSTIIGENLIKPYAKNLSDKHLLLYTRLSVILVAAISCYFAFDDSDIVGLVEASLSLILVCLFAPFTFGLFWKKSSVIGAWSAILIGGLSWLFCYIYNTRIDPTIYGFVISCLSILIGSILYPDKISTKQNSEKQKTAANKGYK